MSVQGNFWKKHTAPLEHVANVEAEHKLNTLCALLLGQGINEVHFGPAAAPYDYRVLWLQRAGVCFALHEAKRAKNIMVRQKLLQPSPSLHSPAVARHSLALYVYWQESMSFGHKPTACWAFQGTGKQYGLTVSLHSLTIHGLRVKNRDVLQELDLNSKQ